MSEIMGIVEQYWLAILALLVAFRDELLALFGLSL